MENPTVHTIPAKMKYAGATRAAIYCRVSSAKKDQIVADLGIDSSATTHGKVSNDQ